MIKIIAEAGIAHCGRVEDAIKLVNAAHAADADVVKFQLYHTDQLVRDVPNWGPLKSCELTPREHERVKQHCDAIGIEWMASCFDTDAVDLAIQLGAKTIKVGSGEIVNHDLLHYIARTGKHLLLSTGAATMIEVDLAVQVFDHANPEKPWEKLSLLHCVSAYPASFEDCNLLAMFALKRRFWLRPVGFSDHTIGFDAAVAAVGVGAEIIERHIMLAPGCPDEAVSFTPETFRGYVATIRRAERMMGNGVKQPTAAELKIRDDIRYRWHVPPDRTSGRETAELGEGYTLGGPAGVGKAP